MYHLWFQSTVCHSPFTSQSEWCRPLGPPLVKRCDCLSRGSHKRHRCTERSSGTILSLSGAMISVTPTARPLASNHQQRGAPNSPLRRFTFRLRPSPLPRLRATNVRPFLLPLDVPMPELPPEADAAGLPDHRPNDLCPLSFTGSWSLPSPNACGSTSATTAA